jgi:large subunit ribosomal protein LX
MKGFRVTGSFADARQGQQPFSVEIAADSEAAAKEQIISTMGSRHKVKRWQISISEIIELANDAIENPVVKYKVTGE